MEIFKPITEYPNYQVSNFGRVYNKKYDRFLKPQVNHGYINICLCKDGKPKLFRVHRLVAFAFIDNPEDKPHIDHIDRNPQNNHVTNLRWATCTENNRNKKNNLPLGDLVGKERIKAQHQYYIDTKKYYCDCCHVAFPCPNHLKRHNKTKGHQNKIQDNNSNVD